MRIRLGRDYFVRIAGSDYSVDPVMVGRMVDAVADLGQVTITGDGRTLGSHVRCWASAVTVIDPAPTSKRLHGCGSRFLSATTTPPRRIR